MGEFIAIWLPSDTVLVWKNLYLWTINVIFYHQQYCMNTVPAVHATLANKNTTQVAGQRFEMSAEHSAQLGCAAPPPCPALSPHTIPPLPHWRLAAVLIAQLYYKQSGFPSSEVFNYEKNREQKVFAGGRVNILNLFPHLNDNILKRNFKYLLVFLPSPNKSVRKPITYYIALIVLDRLCIPDYYRHYPFVPTTSCL